jgi:D-xylose transport system permease protein
MPQEENNVSDQKTVLQKESFGMALASVIKNNMRKYTMIAALLIIWIIFSALTGGLFMSSRNLSNMFLQMVTIAILTNGMVLVMVAGAIDLAAGMVCGTLGALAAWLMSYQGWNPIAAILVTLFCGFIVGCWHGYWIAFQGVPAFIVTLASQIAFKGLTLAITNGKTIGEFEQGFKEIGQGYIPRLFLGEDFYHITTIIIFAIAVVAFVAAELYTRKKRIRNGFTVLRPSLAIAKVLIISASIAWIGMVLASYRGIPYAIIILLVMVGIFTIITTRTPFGRHVYAIGGNVEAARLSGVNVKRTKMYIFMLMGVLCGVASIVFTARLNAATTAAGNLFELDAIAACIIGGTSTTGGIGTVFGAIIGALVMASLDNGMSLMNLPIMYQYIIKGLILLLAVWVDIANRKK